MDLIIFFNKPLKRLDVKSSLLKPLQRLNKATLRSAVGNSHPERNMIILLYLINLGKNERTIPPMHYSAKDL
ncbi:MAG: hypothetical protein K8T10_18375 [Candidatus Eremiobacteraeota bacterium]|nr:hypothetical protein [Candidatus Eremiobacteraeota bacterium]